MLKYLTNYPEVQRKLRASVLSCVPEIADRPPVFEEMNPETIPYLEAVVHEVLRISVVAPSFSRESESISSLACLHPPQFDQTANRCDD